MFCTHPIRFYAAEITSGLAYLHSMNIIYCDLKPENILLDCQGHIILTDLGLCKENMKFGMTTNTFCGTSEYLAPEVVKKQEYGRSVDWWCLGVVTYEMLYSLPPFYSHDATTMYENIIHKPLELSAHISQVLGTCWKVYCRRTKIFAWARGEEMLRISCPTRSSGP